MKSMKSRTQKLMIISLAALFFGAGLLALFTPSLLSTKWGNERFIQLLNERIPGNVYIKQFSVSWFGTQKIEGLSLKDPTGNTVLTFEAFESETPLYTFLSVGPTSGKTTIKSLHAAIKKTDRGLTNLQESLGLGRTSVQLPNELASLEDVDIEMNSPNSLSNMKVKASGKTQQGEIKGKFDIDFNCNKEQESCNVLVQSFPIGLLDGILSVEHPELSGVLTALAGDSVDFKMIEKSQEESSLWTIQATSENLTFSGEGRIENGAFRLTAPASAKITLTPNALIALSRLCPELKEWRLTSRAEIQIAIRELLVPIQFLTTLPKQKQQSALSIDASLNLTGAELIRIKNPEEKADVKNLSLLIKSEENSPWIELHGKGSYNLADTPVNFKLDTKIEKPKNLQGLIRSLYRPYEIQFSLEHLPTKIIDELMGTNDFALAAFGKELTLRMSTSAEDFKTLRLTLNSPYIQIPSILVNIDQNVLQPGSLFLSGLSGTISVPKIELLRSRNKAVVENVTLPWSVKSGFTQFKVEVSGKTTSSGDQNGNFSGHLVASTLGSIENSRLNATFTGETVPTPFIEWITGRDELGAVFGPSLDFDLAVKTSGLQGGVKAALKGPAGNASINATLSNHQITLNEPLILESKGNEELGQLALGKFAPVFRELISSDGKIRLSVSPENFSLPIFPFNPARLQVSNAVLEMGKLTFRNSGDVKSLLSVLKPARSDIISIWTTPVYVSIQNGVANVYRTDVLIMDKYPIASWGKIDLVKNDVQMIIGVTGTALSQAMDIPALEGGTMIQIPVTGTIENAKIDNSKTATKIGSMIAQQSGRPEGLIIGTVLNLAKGKEGNIPPPTTNPLPWAGRDFGNPTSDNDPGKNKSKVKVDPMKEIQKEASNLLKGIFR